MALETEKVKEREMSLSDGDSYEFSDGTEISYRCGHFVLHDPECDDFFVGDTLEELAKHVVKYLKEHFGIVKETKKK
jgi:hypothetical protein